MPVSTPVPFTQEQFDAVTFNADGLVPAIIQEEGTGRVLMMAWMNDESLTQTLETGRTWFWSRSRQEYWCKGETSGDRQYVRGIEVGDLVLFNPEDRYEVEVRGEDYLILRERDIHAVAAPRLDTEGGTGLYL